MIKPHRLSAALLGVVVACSASPLAAQVFVGSDNFNDNTLSVYSGSQLPGVWMGQTANQSGTGGAWVEQNGVMNYTNSVGTAYNRGWLTWANTSSSVTAAGSAGLATSSAYTSSWSAQVNVTNLMASLPASAYTAVGIEVYTVGAAPNNYVLSYSGVALTTNGTWGSRIIGESGVLSASPGTYTPAYNVVDTPGLTSAVLRLDYNAANTTLSSSYSTDGGATFLAVQGYDIGANHLFTANGGLGLRFYAAEGNSAGTVSLGQMTYDNFSVTAVPEPSTYAALAGLAALGVVSWRRRATRAATAFE